MREPLSPRGGMIYSALSPCALRVQGNGKAHVKEAGADESYRPCVERKYMPKKLSALLSYLLPYIIRDELLQWTAKFHRGGEEHDHEGNRLHAPNMEWRWRLLSTVCGRYI